MTTGKLTTLPDHYRAPNIRKTLLIVEDNDTLRDTMIDLLKLEGFKILAAANGAQALQIMEVSRPDLVLSDIAMPVMDGVTFFHRVRNRVEWTHIPFIFLTAFSLKYEVASAQDLLREKVLVKPVDFDLLLNSIHSRLNETH
jgi:CheY-like chemotaxis protein